MILLEATRIERVVSIAEQLVQRGEMNTADAAEKFGVTRRTIQRDLAEIARVLPIYLDDGRWIYRRDDRVEISPY